MKIIVHDFEIIRYKYKNNMLSNTGLGKYKKKNTKS